MNLRLYTLLITLLGSSFLYGCEKTPLEGPPAGPGSSDALRMAFAAAGYEQALSQPFNDTAKIYWEPNWPAKYRKTNARGTAYTYVPLTPVLRSLNNPRRVGKFKMLGVRKFIVIKQCRNTDSLSLATYIAATPQRLPAAVAAAQPFVFAAFSGVLLLQELATNRHARLVYQNGLVVAQAVKPAGPAKGNTANKTAAYECHDYYMCEWSANFRDYNGNYVTYGTLTTGYGSCSDPGYEPCNDWGAGWSAGPPTTQRQCTYVDDPPPPPDDPSDDDSSNSATAFDANTDDQNLRPCVTAVLNGVKELSAGEIAKFIQRFSGHTPGYNWKLQNGSLSTGENGATAGGYDRSTNSITTTFDASQFTQATNLSIARTIMHESIHAYLVTYFANDPVQADKQYPELVMAHAQNSNSTANDLQHDEMVRAWVQQIAYGLQQYGLSQGLNLTNDFYISMAWGGLEATRAFRSLGSTRQQEIRNAILTELTGADASGNPGTQVGSRAGC